MRLLVPIMLTATVGVKRLLRLFFSYCSRSALNHSRKDITHIPRHRELAISIEIDLVHLAQRDGGVVSQPHIGIELEAVGDRKTQEMVDALTNLDRQVLEDELA